MRILSWTKSDSVSLSIVLGARGLYIVIKCIRSETLEGCKPASVSTKNMERGRMEENQTKKRETGEEKGKKKSPDSLKIS